jgi:pimeloyl-ACP methyl ester carboxylesterase
MAGVIERSSVVAQLAYISVPCLVISGEECIARPPEWAKELADGLPNSELWMMSGVGHSPLLEVPEVVNPRILEFFSTH